MRRSLSNQLLRSFLKNQISSNLQFKQVFSTSKNQFFINSVETENKNYNDLSSIKFGDIAKSVISKSSELWNKKDGTFTNVCFQDYMLRLSSIAPESICRFWRKTGLSNDDVLYILLGCECHCGNDEIERKKVESLWGIYTFADQQSRDFYHLDGACKIMARMLVDVGMFREVELLVSRLDSRGILLDYGEIFSDLIEGYVGRFQLKRAIACHDRMKLLGLVSSLASYRALLNYLVQLGETQLSYDMYLNGIDIGLEGAKKDSDIFSKVVRLLCKDGRVQEARNLVKRVAGYGISTHSLVLKAMVDGYCKKKDYEDILSLFVELQCAPETQLGNKIIYSLCKNFGIERAESLMYQLGQLGFISDEKTYGTLIGWSCRAGKLKKAFLYFSEILSRGFKPDIHSYNAIISGLLKEGLWEHAEHILCEMKDGGVIPDSFTFRVLLAGYFKARQFERVKNVVGEMADHGLIQLSLSEDPLRKALVILGLSPDFMKIKRDNDKKFFKTDFFDDLGNGLYLDTDLDEYEKFMVKVLNDSMFPNVNSLVLNSVGAGEMKHAITMLYEMARWGQEPSSSCFSTLLKRLFASPCSMKTLTSLLDKMFELTYNLEEETLNKLVQILCKKGCTSKARIIFEGMLMRRLNIENETYTTLLKGFCKKQDLICFRDCFNFARKHNWTPKLADVRATFGCLYQLNLLNEALKLFEVMLACYPHNLSDVLNAFLENLCGGGLTSTACVLVEELLQQGCYLDSMAYTYLANGFCKEKKFTEATLILDTILAKNLNLSEDVVLQLIPQLCKSGNFEKAVVLKDAYSGKLPSTQAVYRALLSGFCKFDRDEKAVNLLQEMLIKGLTPDIEEYEWLIEGYCRGNNFVKALELTGLIMRKNLTISILCYRNLVRLMCFNGKFNVACGLKELTIVESGFPNLVRYNILIYHLFSTRRIDLVHILLDELHNKGMEFDEVTYNFVTHGFSLCKDTSNSLHYLSSMIARKFWPSNRSLRGAMRCLVSNGKLAEALNLSEVMVSKGWIHGVVIQNIIVDSLLCHGKLQEAVNFLNRIVGKGLLPETVNYEYIIKRLCQHGLPEKALDLYHIMLKKGKQLDSTSFDYMIRGFSSGNRLDLAMDLHSEMLIRKLKPDISTWATLVQRLSESDRAEEAEKLLDLMIKNGESPSKEMCICLINKHHSENNLSKASKLVQAMQRNGYEPDFETHWSLISKIGDSKDDGSGGNRHFLSRLLSQVGFSWNNSKAKNR